MTPAQPIHSHATLQEYLRYEYDAKFRHEWRDGEVVAMAGGSPDHSLRCCRADAAASNRRRRGMVLRGDGRSDAWPAG